MANDDQKIGGALAAAACGLLGIGVPALSSAAEGEPAWDIDSAFLYYGESDGRVKDLSLSSHATRDFGDERRLGVDLGIDSLTGASPSGAIAASGAQTFTSPSGRDTYTISPGGIPLDDTFHDTRFALNGSWTQPFARLYTVTAGLGFSDEFDYQHVGANAGITRDFNERNTTVNFAVAYGNDTIKPVGGIRAPFSAMGDVVAEDESPANRIDGSDTKTVMDVLLGVTQVLGRHSVLRLNYSYSDSSGYLTDPYKLLSVVDPLTGAPVARAAAGNGGATGLYLFENRPDSRRRQGLYAELRQDFSGKVLQLGYRYSTDDWDVDSNTLEARLRLAFGEHSYLEPHLRYYQQSAASFYRYSLADGADLPEFASADARLADMSSCTAGLKYGRTLAGGNEWSARLELYRQKAKKPDATQLGSTAGIIDMPDFSAVILQFGYRFKL
jgi:hypothetical protein